MKRRKTNANKMEEGREKKRYKTREEEKKKEEEKKRCNGEQGKERS